MEIQRQSETFAYRQGGMDWDEYRTERRRQEDEMEAITMGYPADEEAYKASTSYKPLITPKDWMKSKAVGPGQQKAMAAEPATHDVYTPDPDAWGGDGPAW